MASTYSSNLRLEKMGTGDQSGTWGTTVNTTYELLEDAISGYVSVAHTDAASITLTTANGADDQARNMTVEVTGALTAVRQVIIPASEKVYNIKNATTGGFGITVKTAAGTGVTIGNGATAHIACDGTDCEVIGVASDHTHDDRYYTESEVDALVTAAAPAGAVMHFAMNSPPTGWLKANGAAVSRTTYATLFAAISTTFGSGDGSTTFNLPDLRGEFIRGWDDSRGVDSGRVFGSWQDSDNKSHTHTASTNTTGAHTHSGTTASDSHSHTGTTSTGGAHTHTYTAPLSTVEGANSSFGGFENTTSASTGSSGSHSHTFTTSSDSHSHTFTTGSSGDHSHTVTVNSSGGTEARPRNVALLGCIKY